MLSPGLSTIESHRKAPELKMDENVEKGMTVRHNRGVGKFNFLWAGKLEPREFCY